MERDSFIVISLYFYTFNLKIGMNIDDIYQQIKYSFKELKRHIFIHTFD
ncbi:hypothetical protein OAT16_02205 [Prolixibacteraceae bacterium]|nr:hypothetical protein [Prolixibacteraceae bacterium]